MAALMPSFAALAVTMLYCAWDHYRRTSTRQSRSRTTS